MIDMTLLFSIRVGDARTLAPRTTQQLAGSSDRSRWMAISAVVQWINLQRWIYSLQWMYIDGSQRETSVWSTFIYINLSNPQTQQKIKCTNINMQYIVQHFSSESLVQCSVTYNRDKKQCTRTTNYTVHAFGRSVIIACCTLGFQYWRMLFASIL